MIWNVEILFGGGDLKTRYFIPSTEYYNEVFIRQYFRVKQSANLFIACLSSYENAK